MKKIVTCLDVRNGILTKGVKFLGNIDIGDPVEAAEKYCDQGVDELVFYDFTATHEKRGTMLDVAAKVAARIKNRIPFGIGGGIRNLNDIRAAFESGADKVHINTSAVLGPQLVADAVKEFGSEHIVLSMDVLEVEKTEGIPSGFEVVIQGGRKRMGMDAVEWAKHGVKLGAGEIVVNSIDADGTKEGFHVPLTRAIALGVKEACKSLNISVPIPVVASGGGGTVEHIYSVLTEGFADVALVSSMLHFGEYTAGGIKDSLRQMGLDIN